MKLEREYLIHDIYHVFFHAKRIDQYALYRAVYREKESVKQVRIFYNC